MNPGVRVTMTIVATDHGTFAVEVAAVRLNGGVTRWESTVPTLYDATCFASFTVARITAQKGFDGRP